MKYLSIDYGAKLIGTAVSNDEATIAFPRGSIVNDERCISALIQMIQDEKVGAIVMGDTRAFSGASNLITAEADAFGEKLASHAGIAVKRVSEAWSTVEAARYAPKGKEHDDAAAAAVILQRFLDMGARK